MKIELTKTEINHLLTLIDVNKRDEWYVGNQAQYWKRSDKIYKELNSQLEKQEYRDALQRLNKSTL